MRLVVSCFNQGTIQSLIGCTEQSAEHISFTKTALCLHMCQILHTTRLHYSLEYEVVQPDV